MDPLGTGHSMGTVSRQESVADGSMHDAAPGTFKMALLICLIFSAGTWRAKKNKNMIRPLARIILRGLDVP
jgi:hypothetical protein